MSLVTREIEFNEDHLLQVANLLKMVFKSEHLSLDYLKWLYLENPNGKVVGFDAFDGDKLAGHYATIPISCIYKNKEIKALLSLNTVTGPNYRGKGLFTSLAEKTYELAKSKGYEIVLGVANINSTYGFVNKLGFELVEQLEARIGRLKYTMPRENEFSFSVNRTNEFLDWRFKRPMATYFKSDDTLYTKANQYVSAYLWKDENNLISNPKGKKSSIVLWIGSKKSAQGLEGVNVNIPKAFRPSPLNLIFKPLTNRVKTLKTENVNFQLIDFDAY